MASRKRSSRGNSSETVEDGRGDIKQIRRVVRQLGLLDSAQEYDIWFNQVRAQLTFERQSASSA